MENGIFESLGISTDLVVIILFILVIIQFIWIIYIITKLIIQQYKLIFIIFIF